jgi:antitoxin component YwqK of YwqJK toxin-antitoxin module
MSEANYRAGLVHGKTTSFYESGAKKAVAEYQDGVLHGISINWAEDGRQQSSSTFVNGVLQHANAKAD